VPINKRGKPKDNANPIQHSLRHKYKMDVEDKKKVEHSSDEDNEEEEGLMKVNFAFFYVMEFEGCFCLIITKCTFIVFPLK